MLDTSDHVLARLMVLFSVCIQHGQTVLFWAVGYPTIEFLRHLLENRRANVNVQDKVSVSFLALPFAKKNPSGIVYIIIKVGTVLCEISVFVIFDHSLCF